MTNTAVWQTAIPHTDMCTRKSHLKAAARETSKVGQDLLSRHQTANASGSVSTVRNTHDPAIGTSKRREL